MPIVINKYTLKILSGQKNFLKNLPGGKINYFPLISKAKTG